MNVRSLAREPAGASIADGAEVVGLGDGGELILRAGEDVGSIVGDAYE